MPTINMERILTPFGSDAGASFRALPAGKARFVSFSGEQHVTLDPGTAHLTPIPYAVSSGKHAQGVRQRVRDDTSGRCCLRENK